MKKYVICILAALLQLVAEGKVRLPHIIGSHMVLQQQSSVTIWGWANPGERVAVKVGWDTATYTTQTGSGATWQLKIKAPRSGRP